jgi:uncharacterized membrane protein YcaP (DUF421 family)
MKKEEIHLWDLKRILFGQAPPEFLLEVLIRSLIIYISVIIVMRLVGKRMNGQLTIIEMSVMVMMGAILSLPMQAPDRGVLQGILLLIAILLLLRGLNLLAFKSSRLEKLLHGEAALLVKDGVVQLPQLAQTKVTRQQLYAVLRGKNILHLGKVKRLYMEPYGLFSVYEEKVAKPGLSTLPPDDKQMLEQLQLTGQQVCETCGSVQLQKEPVTHCHYCGSDSWTVAVL